LVTKELDHFVSIDQERNSQGKYIFLNGRKNEAGPRNLFGMKKRQGDDNISAICFRGE